MATSLVERAHARQARSYGIGALGALTLVSGPAIHVWVTVVILVLVVVIVPAVWSRKAYRRKAGRDVLAIFLRGRAG